MTNTKAPQVELIKLETERLILRRLTHDDVDNLVGLYSDPDVMRYYPKLLNKTETREQLDRVFERYETYGYNLMATILKEDGSFIGRCGLTVQTVNGQEDMEIGYMLHTRYQGKGYATEAARALRDFGFKNTPCEGLISLIRPENVPSQRVAMRNSMQYVEDCVHANLAHRVYAINRQDWSELSEAV